MGNGYPYTRKRNSSAILAWGILLCLPFLGWAAARTYNSWMFDIRCGDNIKRAADANKVETATAELEKVVAYMEANRLTSGNTAALQFLWTPPNRDVGFWYTNIKDALAELKALPPTATPLERSNMLIKLRETLLDHGEKGDRVTVPAGISVFPHNALYFWWCTLSLVAGTVGSIMICVWCSRL